MLTTIINSEMAKKRAYRRMQQLATLTTDIVSDANEISVKPDCIRVSGEEMRIVIKRTDKYNRSTIRVALCETNAGNNVTETALKFDRLTTFLTSLAKANIFKREYEKTVHDEWLANQNTEELKADRLAKQKELDSQINRAVISAHRAVFDVPISTASVIDVRKDGIAVYHHFNIIAEYDRPITAYELACNAVLVALQSAKTKRAKLTSSAVSAPKEWDDRVRALTVAYCKLVAQHKTFNDAGLSRISNGKKIGCQSTYLNGDMWILKVMNELSSKNYDSADMVTIAYSAMIDSLTIKRATKKAVKTISIKNGSQPIELVSKTNRILRKAGYSNVKHAVYAAYKAVNKQINDEAKIVSFTKDIVADPVKEIDILMTFINDSIHQDDSLPIEIIKAVNGAVEAAIEAACTPKTRAVMQPKIIDFLSTYGRCKQIFGKTKNASNYGIAECAGMCNIGKNTAHTAVKAFRKDIETNYPSLFGNRSDRDKERLDAEARQVDREAKHYQLKHDYADNVGNGLKSAFYGTFGHWWDASPSVKKYGTLDEMYS